jgi:hypothetical protein
VQPSAGVSAVQRRSRPSITAMNISNRCKPPPQHQWRPLSWPCACVPWGDHGARQSASWCGGTCARAARQWHSAVGRTLCRTRAVRIVAHQSRPSDLRNGARDSGRQQHLRRTEVARCEYSEYPCAQQSARLWPTTASSADGSGPV